MGAREPGSHRPEPLVLSWIYLHTIQNSVSQSVCPDHQQPQQPEQHLSVYLKCKFRPIEVWGWGLQSGLPAPPGDFDACSWERGDCPSHQNHLLLKKITKAPQPTPPPRMCSSLGGGPRGHERSTDLLSALKERAGCRPGRPCSVLRTRLPVSQWVTGSWCLWKGQALGLDQKGFKASPCQSPAE